MKTYTCSDFHLIVFLLGLKQFISSCSVKQPTRLTQFLSQKRKPKMNVVAGDPKVGRKVADAILEIEDNVPVFFLPRKCHTPKVKPAPPESRFISDFFHAS